MNYDTVLMPMSDKIVYIVSLPTSLDCLEDGDSIFFAKLDDNPIHINVFTQNDRVLYLKDHKVALGMVNIETGEEFEVFGFASEDGWTRIHWSEAFKGVEGGPLFMKKLGMPDPGFWKNWQTATLSTTWLNENTILGYAQVIVVVQAQSSGGKQKFWSPSEEPKMVSILLKVKKYLANHHKAYSVKTQFDPHMQPPAVHQMNAKEQFRKAKTQKIEAEMAKCFTDGNVPDDLDVYCDVLAMMWSALDEKAVKEHQAIADEVNKCVTEPPSLSDIYKNQHMIDQATISLLEHMIRFGTSQLGKVTWIAHCIYEDTNGKVCGVNVKIHSKAKSWSVVPNNDLNSKEYFQAAMKWAVHGFEEDNSTVPSEG
ncbi:hypothetical protein EDD85DRAFT_956381 [Armillaria nabsnona]|nr:hypothetical protein EDD85DRAFT_956381 [Armillaria nabsnona]